MKDGKFTSAILKKNIVNFDIFKSKAKVPKTDKLGTN